MRSLDLLTDSLDRRRPVQADIRWNRYFMPLGDNGAHVGRRPFSNKLITLSGPSRTFFQGQTVPTGSNTGFLAQGEMILVEPPLQKRGGERFPEISSMLSFGAAIEDADPPTVDRGFSDQPITVTGYGFRSDHRIAAVVPDPSVTSEVGWVADPFVTIHDETWVSDVEFSILVDVAAGASIGHLISLALLEPGDVVPA